MGRLNNIKGIQKEVSERGNVMYFTKVNKDFFDYVSASTKAITGSQSAILLLPTSYKKEVDLFLEFCTEVEDINFIAVEDEFMCDIYSDESFMFNGSEFFCEYVDGLENGLVITDGESVRSSILIIKSDE